MRLILNKKSLVAQENQAFLQELAEEQQYFQKLHETYHKRNVKLAFTTNLSFPALLKLNYLDLCFYFIQKYNHPPQDYFCNEFFRSTNRKKNSKTALGLYIHHIDENKAIMLSTKSFAKERPFAFQQKERLIYCTLLEHLLLHIKIVEYYRSSRPNVGTGGIYNFMVPELNDIYSGIQYQQPWKINCTNAVQNQKKDYFLLLKYLIKIDYDKPLLKSFNGGRYLKWKNENNAMIYQEIIALGLNLANESTASLLILKRHPKIIKFFQDHPERLQKAKKHLQFLESIIKKHKNNTLQYSQISQEIVKSKRIIKTLTMIYVS